MSHVVSNVHCVFRTVRDELRVPCVELFWASADLFHPTLKCWLAEQTCTSAPTIFEEKVPNEESIKPLDVRKSACYSSKGEEDGDIFCRWLRQPRPVVGWGK